MPYFGDRIYKNALFCDGSTTSILDDETDVTHLVTATQRQPGCCSDPLVKDRHIVSKYESLIECS
jgi:hypothetical protein